MAGKSEQDIAEKALEVLDSFSPYSTYLDKSTLSNVPGWINTGSRMLNAIISGSMEKGIPMGRVTLFAGESSTGKSYICQKIVGNAQKMGLYTVVFDTENAIDAQMAINLGADPTKIKYFPAKSVEQVRNAIYALLKKIEELKLEGKFLIVIDSLANILSEIEMNRMEGDSTASDMGTISRSIKSLLKMCTVLGGQTNTTFVITNHVYDNPNERYPDLVKCMSGGKACRYLPSVVVQMAKKNVKEKEYSGEKDDTALGKGINGIEMRCMCVKNRFIRPLIEGSMYLSWKTGLDEEYGTLDLAVASGAIVRRGTVYDLYDGTSLGYAKVFRKKKDLWEEKIYPEIERRLPTLWGYSAGSASEQELEEAIEAELLNSEIKD